MRQKMANWLVRQRLKFLLVRILFAITLAAKHGDVILAAGVADGDGISAVSYVKENDADTNDITSGHDISQEGNTTSEKYARGMAGGHDTSSATSHQAETASTSTADSESQPDFEQVFATSPLQPLPLTGQKEDPGTFSTLPPRGQAKEDPGALVTLPPQGQAKEDPGALVTLPPQGQAKEEPGALVTLPPQGQAKEDPGALVTLPPPGQAKEDHTTVQASTPESHEKEEETQAVPVHREPSPFAKVENLFADFASQVVALHSVLCGNTCRFRYSETRHLPAANCSACHCDAACRVYDDCCPDELLLSTTPEVSPGSAEMKATAEARDLYTCEIARMSPPPFHGDFNNYFSMINYCPLARGSRVNDDVEEAAEPPSSRSSTMGGSRVGLEAKCENRGGEVHWDYHRPVTSRQGLVYRNKFCAQCHGEHRDNLTDWTASVTCNASLLYKVSSPSEAYYLALNTTGCDVRFGHSTSALPRRCNSVAKPVISSCNQTGLWRVYDEKIARACASFTAVVMRSYKNAFCYMCNHDISFEFAEYMLSQGSHGSIVGRASFFALLDLTDGEAGKSTSTTEDGKGSGAVSAHDDKRRCEEGTILDPLKCQCRSVACAAGLRLTGDNCTEVFASTNYFGFRVHSRLYITSERPIDQEVPKIALHSLIQVLRSADLLTSNAQGYSTLACHDDRTLILDVLVDVYGRWLTPLRSMAESILWTPEAFTRYIANAHLGLTTTNVTLVMPSPYRDVSRRYPETIPLDCPTRARSLSLGAFKMSSGPSSVNVREISFYPLYNTTVCPRLNLTDAEFGNFTSGLKPLGLTEDNVTFDVICETNATFYLVCVEDFRAISPPDECSLTEANEKTAVGDFEDRWTWEGMTSLVCTCVSLVGLLCVMASYAALPPLREGAGLSTLAMACLLFLAQALHELGLEQFEFDGLCLALSVLIHFSWLSAVFMMTSCTLQLFYSVTFPLQARARLHSGRALRVSLLGSFSLAAVIVGLTMLANHASFGDLGYPAKYLCFIRRSLSRQLGFGLPLGLAVLFNVVLFLIAMVSIRRRPQVSSTRQDRVSLKACVRLSVVTGACWLTLFLAALPGTRPWLEYVTAALLGIQGLLLATSLLLNRRVADLWRRQFARWQKQRMARRQGSQPTSSGGTRTTGLQRTDNSTPPASGEQDLSAGSQRAKC